MGCCIVKLPRLANFNIIKREVLKLQPIQRYIKGLTSESVNDEEIYGVKPDSKNWPGWKYTSDEYNIAPCEVEYDKNFISKIIF